MARKISGADLAKLLDDELEAEDWGDIDAWWFKPYDPADYDLEPGEEPDEDHEASYHKKFQELLERVAAKIK